MITEQQAIEQVRGKLLEYLQQNYEDTIKVNEHFRCPNPDHEDLDPSAIVQDRGTPEYCGEVGHCFGCQASFNIFTLLHWDRSYPIEGTAFYRVTLPTIAEEFDIEYEREQLSEEDHKELTKRRAYADASNVIVSGREYVKELIEARGWTLALAERLRFGGLESREQFINDMTAIGWSEIYLESIDLNRNLFRSDGIIFSIADHTGQIVAFARRNEDGEESTSKYINSENSDIYQKRNVLYNLHRIDKNERVMVYIVEGYADVISMIAKGYERVVAICGTAFTAEHAELLYYWGATHLRLLFDGDAAGAIATKRAINHLSKNQQFKVRIFLLPEGEDPDSWLRTRMLVHPKIKNITPFEWTLKNTLENEDTDIIELATDMISAIIMEPNMIRRQEMVEALADATKIDRSTISAQIRAAETERMFEKRDKEAEIKNKLAMLARGEKGLDEILSRIHGEWDQVKLSFDNQAAAGTETYVEAIEQIREILAHRDEISGFRLTKFEGMMRDLGGIPDAQAMILVAGKPNVGKTSWLRYLALDLISSNDDIFILYMSIDDNKQKMIPSLVATMKNLSLYEAFRPKTITDPVKREHWEEGFRTLTNGMRTQLAIEDQTTGNTLDALESHIDLYRRTYPDKKMLVMLDNFHLLADNNFSFGQNERAKAKTNSTRLKAISVRHNIPIIATAELRKVDPGKRATPEDIAETAQLDYDADLTLMLHNDLKANPASPIYWLKDQEKAPILEVRATKNKISAFGGWWFYAYKHTHNHFVQQPQSVAKQLVEEIVKGQQNEQYNTKGMHGKTM